MRASIALSAATALFSIAFAQPSGAATIAKSAIRNPANACALSIPTIDTGVRPKATGFRNEGTVNNFVVCSFDIETSGEGFTSLYAIFASFDGATHTFSCTAMDRTATLMTGDYSTKSITVNGAGGYTIGLYAPADFPTTQLKGGATSVTCLLPPGTTILSLQGLHNVDVGQ